VVLGADENGALHQAPLFWVASKDRATHPAPSSTGDLQILRFRLAHKLDDETLQISFQKLLDLVCESEGHDLATHLSFEYDAGDEITVKTSRALEEAIVIFLEQPYLRLVAARTVSGAPGSKAPAEEASA
jgi:hypothetical protein